MEDLFINKRNELLSQLEEYSKERPLGRICENGCQYCMVECPILAMKSAELKERLGD